jgi:hypothetical protein
MRAAQTRTSMMKRRGGLMPAAPGQDFCDGCNQPLDPDEAIEVTVTRPSEHVGELIRAGLIATRLYGHYKCRGLLAAAVTRLLEAS